MCEEREVLSVSSISFEEFKKSIIRVTILSHGLDSVYDSLKAGVGLEKR